ncbi:hypothetical protein [Longimicrobium sp.]|uniref:hypothetical protein n=1 Tax=Longimicrobium sp. TaxID=2029185 RepID=UPI003B3A49A7
MPTFPLTLRQTYFNEGFFYVIVDYDRYVRKAEGAVRLRLGRRGVEIEAKLDRRANMNGTARIRGGAPLRNWFHSNFEPMDIVAVDLSSEEIIILNKLTSERG